MEKLDKNYKIIKHKYIKINFLKIIFFISLFMCILEFAIYLILNLIFEYSLKQKNFFIISIIVFASFLFIVCISFLLWIIFFMSLRNAVIYVGEKDISKKIIYPFHSSILLHEPCKIENYILKRNEQKLKFFFNILGWRLSFWDPVWLLFLSIACNYYLKLLIKYDDIVFSIIMAVIAIFISTYISFLINEAWNKDKKIKLEYQELYNNFIKFKKFLNLTNYKSLNYTSKSSINFIEYFPNYLIQYINLNNFCKEKLFLEFDKWKVYINNFNNIQNIFWILCIKELINNNILNKNKKHFQDFNNKVDVFLKNIFNLFENNSNWSLVSNRIIEEYDEIYNFYKVNQKKFRFIINTIIRIYDFKVLPSSKFFNINVIDERNRNLNIFQLNYLEYLFSIYQDENIKNK